MIISFLPVSGATAQSWIRSFETPDGRYELEWGPDWDADIDDSDTDISTVTLQSDLSVVSLMFVSADMGIGMEVFFELFRESFQSSTGSDFTQIDSWETRTSMHSMDLMEVEGIELAIYSTLEEGRRGAGSVLMLFGTLPSAFESSFEQLQEEVTLNGAPLFADEDAESLAAILDGDAPASSADRSTRRSGRSTTSTADGTTGERRGATDGTTFRDSTYGFTVVYSSPWSATSPSAGSLTLQDGSFNTAGFMGMPFFGSRSAFIDIMESSWQGAGGTYLGTVEATDRVLMAVEAPGGGVLAQEIIFVDATTAVVVSVVLIGDVDGAVRSLRQNVFVDGAPVLRDWNDL